MIFVTRTVCCSPRDSRARAGDFSCRHLGPRRLGLRSLDRLLAVRRRHRPRNVAKHRVRRPRLPSRTFRGRFRRGQRLHCTLSRSYASKTSDGARMFETPMARRGRGAAVAFAVNAQDSDAGSRAQSFASSQTALRSEAADGPLCIGHKVVDGA